MNGMNSSYPLPKRMQRDPDPKLNICIYGNNGVGKTTMAATAQAHPQLADCLWIDVEGGLLSVYDNPDLPQGGLVAEVNSSKDLEAIYWAVKSRKENEDNPYHTVNTVIMDSGTELQTLRLDELVDAGVNSETNKKKKEKRDYDEVYQKDFGKNARFLGRWFRAFRDLDVNFILTAYERVEYKESKVGDRIERKIERVIPEFSPKVSQHVRGYMDYVWWLHNVEDDKGNVRRMALLETSGVYYAKSRGNLVQRFGKRIDWTDLSQPILPEIYNSLIQGVQTSTEEEEHGERSIG